MAKKAKTAARIQRVWEVGQGVRVDKAKHYLWSIVFQELLTYNVNTAILILDLRGDYE